MKQYIFYAPERLMEFGARTVVYSFGLELRLNSYSIESVETRTRNRTE
jgi:hypothetical protein